MKLGRTLSLLEAVYQKFNEAKSPFLAGSIAYSIFFSLFPLLLGTVAVFGYVLPEYPNILTLISEIFPTQGAAIAQIINGVISERGRLGFIAILLLLWSGTGLFMTLGQALDMVWRLPPVPGWRAIFKQYAIAFAMTLSLFPFILALTILYGVAIALNLPGKAFILQGLPGIVITLCLIPIYHYLPSRRGPRGRAVLASVIAGPLWELLRIGFGWYLEHFSRLNMVYGPIAGMVGFLLWLNLCGMVILLGASASSVLREKLK